MIHLGYLVILGLALLYGESPSFPIIPSPRYSKTDLNLAESLDMTDLAESLDMTDLAESLDMTDLAEVQDMTEIAEVLDMTDLAEVLVMTA